MGLKKKLLLRLIPTLLKMPLTFLGLIFGASIGREGPTVQLGASIMLAWGEFCNRFRLVKRRFKKMICWQWALQVGLLLLLTHR